MTDTATADQRAQVEALRRRVEAARELAPLDFSAEDVARMLDVSKGSIYAAVRAGTIGHYRVGRKVRITRAHLDAFRAGTTVGE